MSAALHAFEGRCHCGALGFTLRTSKQPEQWTVRACQCTFCRGHGARTTADPDGSVSFRIADPSKLKRYRFGTRSSDFLVCGECGTEFRVTRLGELQIPRHCGETMQVVRRPVSS